MSKLIRLRTFGRILGGGSQVVTLVIYSRTKNRRYALSLAISHDDEQSNRRMVGDALRRLRACWRDEVLGKAWQYRAATRRFRQRERESQLADLRWLATGLRDET